MLTEMPHSEEIINLCEGIRVSRNSFDFEQEDAVVESEQDHAPGQADPKCTDGAAGIVPPALLADNLPADIAKRNKTDENRSAQSQRPPGLRRSLGLL